MDWSEVQTKDPIYLNLGGCKDCHPKAGYEDYISVDLNHPEEDSAVKHDLRDPIPIPDGSITRIHTEDCLEHFREEEITRLLSECFRLLKHGGRMRVGVPDYNNPKDRLYLKRGNDSRYPNHLTLTNYKLMKRLIEVSPFSRYKFYQYWDGDNFIYEKIDHSFGIIKRTPDNDPRCRRVGPIQNVKGWIIDFLYKVTRGFRCSEKDLLVRKGHRLYVTSVVVDLFKE